VEIQREITKVLKGIKDVKIYGDEIKEGFKRPCYFLKSNIESVERENWEYNSVLITHEICYFGNPNTNLEYLKMYELLKRNFTRHLEIGDRKLLPKNIRCDFEDGYISFRFTLEFYDVALYEDQIPENPLFDGLEIDVNRIED